ncbi:receptor protein-tyrosine kinase CEPR1 [Nymphaea colorata]|nr:receptor protein-tyrosine kinase CEPR1 [Nymphaea colorata]
MPPHLNACFSRFHTIDGRHLYFRHPFLPTQQRPLHENSLSGPFMYKWSVDDAGQASLQNSSSATAAAFPFHCQFLGVKCDTAGSVISIDVSGWSLTGQFPSHICTYLPDLRALNIGNNFLQGNFPVAIINCSYLEILNMTKNQFSGGIPDLSRLGSLRVLDVSFNRFSGKFPMSVTNLSAIELLNFNENPAFDPWELPEAIVQLRKLRTLILMTCSLIGQIPAFLGNMTWLVDLELGGNCITGHIPPEIGRMESLKLLELYYNQLTGEIPAELGNLSQLVDIDLSVNGLTGSIPETLCRLPALATLQLYNNSLTGKVPQEIGNSTRLIILSIYENYLTGMLPQDLGEFSNLEVLDVSENRLTGPLPPSVCKSGKLLYFLVLENQFSGELPESYARCLTLLRFRVSKNSLSGTVPEQLWGLPVASIIDLGYNDFEGSISPYIGNTRNLSELYVAGNRFSGRIPPEIGAASLLIKLDLSRNLFSGELPAELGKLKLLNLLLLQQNNFVGQIPESFCLLKSINLLNLSNNQLTGTIPECFSKLLPNSLDFSNNQLSGPVPVNLIKGGLAQNLVGNPNLCLREHMHTGYPVFPFCERPVKKRTLNSVWVIGVSVMAAFLGLLSFFKRLLAKANIGMEDSGYALSATSWDIKCFHKLKFDVYEILEQLDQKNIIGHGGSGTVYKIQLGCGESVAVKKFWTRKTKNSASDQYYLDMELKAEVETLGSIRHKNIVKLYCCFSNADYNLLVYEYMPNGNLWDALHQAGRSLLDWPARHRIAVGVAHGLSYLHHDSSPPIIHRDIKTTNILLDADFQPKVADFGVAKVLQAQGGGDSTSVIAGTYGYLAPEYAYSSKPTGKCDVYSFGVVLMELITGRKPLDPEFGESQNIVFWISCKASTKEGAAEVLDKRLSAAYKDDMIQALRIAMRCTCSLPALRPAMNEVVTMLIEADPQVPCKSLNKVKNLS